jgi:hypothetical protein
MIGFQSSACFASEIIWSARVGEQMKCTITGRTRRVPCKSRGDNLIRELRYSKLRNHTDRVQVPFRIEGVFIRLSVVTNV